MLFRSFLLLFIILECLKLSVCSPFEEFEEEQRGGTLETLDDPNKSEKRKAAYAFPEFEKQLKSRILNKRLVNLEDNDEDEDDLTERLASLDPEKRLSSYFTKSFARALNSQTRMMKDIGTTLDKLGKGMVRQFG